MLAMFTLIMLLGTGFAAAMLLRRRTAARVTEPSCGKCGYCIRGLESLVCLECGSDLREAGILTPGDTKPLRTGKRLLLWTVFVPLPALLLAGLLMPLISPQWLRTAHRRVIFSQADYCNVTITAESHGKKLVYGSRQSMTTPVASEVLSLTFNNNAPMEVKLPSRQYRFTDPQGKTVTGKYDAAAIEKWLNAYRFTGPRIVDRATEIAAAIDEIGTPAGRGFTHFSRDPSRGNASNGIAHPTFSFTHFEGNALTLVPAIALPVLIWLAGLPLVLRNRRRGQPPAANLP
ncbi:MAG: hypothetical protein ABIP55_17435, partial [Tepidisphaeraceae bacterium]